MTRAAYARRLATGYERVLARLIRRGAVPARERSDRNATEAKARPPSDGDPWRCACARRSRQSW